MSEHVVDESGEMRLQLFMSVFSVRMSFAFMHLPVCVLLSISVQASTVRKGLCYCCNEPGIC